VWAAGFAERQSRDTERPPDSSVQVGGLLIAPRAVAVSTLLPTAGVISIPSHSAGSRGNVLSIGDDETVGSSALKRDGFVLG
jgi:hypothetical protein